MKRIQIWVYAAVAAVLAGAAGFLDRYTRLSGLAATLNLYSQYTYDAALLLKAAAAVGSTANGTLELDVGAGLLDALMVIDVTTLEIDSSDESYEVVLQGSTVAGFGTAAAIAPLASMTICDKASTRGAAGVLANGTDDVIGRYVVPFRNERNGTLYRYLRIKTIVVGSIGGAGITYSAWVAKR